MGKARPHQEYQDPLKDLQPTDRKNLLKKLKKHLEEIATHIVETDCWEIDKAKSGNGTFLTVNEKDNDRVVLNFAGFIFKHHNKFRIKKESAAVAHAFFKILGIREEKYNASHICHNPKCVNPRHLVYEDAEYNRSRNFCCGGQGCQHEPKCICPGVRFHIIQNKKPSFCLTE